LPLALCLITAGCAAPDAHAPPFARQPYETFARNDAVAIALDEWRLFGMRVDDNDGAGYVQTDTAMAERQPGGWQRIGEYWWEGLNANDPDNTWTGKHDAHGQLFPAAVNGHYAWSAAFISYVMRIAGAGRDFPYAADHAFYINYAARAAKGEVRDPLLIAENPLNYAPRLGDLVCSGRGKARSLTYADLPTTQNFPAHCAIVTAGAADQISVIGGNVEDAVALTHVPTNNAGMVGPPWFVVLRVMYRR
jgi:hypothetical protein